MASVQWMGDYRTRIISASEWSRVGAPGPTVSWNAENGWSIPESAFTQAQLDVLDDYDGFLIGQPDGPRPYPPNVNLGYERETYESAYYREIKEIYETILAMPIEGITEINGNITKIQPRYGTAAQWTSANPVLAMGELGYETDTKKWKRGDGTTVWSGIDYDYSTSELHKQLVRTPDSLIVGSVTRDANGAATTASVVWPDGTPGTYTAVTLSTEFPGAVDSYSITYGNPVIKTYTQPAVTRDATGAATTVPAIMES